MHAVMLDDGIAAYGTHDTDFLSKHVLILNI